MKKRHKTRYQMRCILKKCPIGITWGAFVAGLILKDKKVLESDVKELLECHNDAFWSVASKFFTLHVCYKIGSPNNEIF